MGLKLHSDIIGNGTGDWHMAAGNLFYDLERPRALSTLTRMQAAASSIRLESRQPSSEPGLKYRTRTLYTYRFGKKFPRNPYCMNNIMDVWECDAFHVQGISKYNDKD